MSTYEIQLKELLKKHGYSITKPRLRIFKALLGSVPRSMSELVSAVEPDVDRASAYRAIELFESLGIVHRLHYGWKYKLELSDLFHAHHHHLTCLGCGDVVQIDGDTHIEKDIAELAAQHSFTVTLHQLELQGYCANCHTKRV